MALLFVPRGCDAETDSANRWHPCTLRFCRHGARGSQRNHRIHCGAPDSGNERGWIREYRVGSGLECGGRGSRRVPSVSISQEDLEQGRILCGGVAEWSMAAVLKTAR